MSASNTCRARWFRVYGAAGFFLRIRYYIGRTKEDAKRQFFSEFSAYNDVYIKNIKYKSNP